MKKSFVLLAGLIALAFALVAAIKQWSAAGTGSEAETVDAEKQRIKTFWNTYSQASAFRTRGEFEAAIAAYRDALRSNPTHEDSLYHLGTTLEEIGDYNEAKATFVRMIELNPSSGRALGELGKVQSLLAPGAPLDFAEARRALLRNVQINREQAGPFQRLGLLDLNQGRFEAALENFRIAAAAGSPEGIFLVGYTLFLEKKYQEAVPYFRRLLESYARDKKVTGRGVLSEGDILPAPGKPLTAVERSGLKSMLFLYWASRRMGDYPEEIPREFQVRARPDLKPEFREVSVPGGSKPRWGRAAWADFDKDGRLDLVIVGNDQPLVLYRNLGGKFVDVTHSAGLEGISDVWDAVWADYDGDGFPDLYLIRRGYFGTGENILLHNNGNGKFTDVTAAMGLRGERATARALFFDFDGDGRLDLLEIGASDSSHGSLRLFRNAGSRFIDQTQSAGLRSQGTAVDAAIGDYDRDGRPDVFVLNWKREAKLYHNQGNAKFSDATVQAGLESIGDERFSVLFFDFDRDGLLDLLVSSHAPFEDSVRCLLQPDFRPVRNTPRLFRNRGNGSFEEVTQRVGLNRCYGTMQAIASDIDSDGWPDLLLINGSMDAERLEPSVVLRNLQGKEFREWFSVPGFDRPGNFIGATVATFDQDGRVALYFAPNAVLRDTQSPGGLYVSLRGRKQSQTPPLKEKAASEIPFPSAVISVR